MKLALIRALKIIGIDIGIDKSLRKLLALTLTFNRAWPKLLALTLTSKFYHCSCLFCDTVYRDLAKDESRESSYNTSQDLLHSHVFCIFEVAKHDTRITVIFGMQLLLASITFLSCFIDKKN